MRREEIGDAAPVIAQAASTYHQSMARFLARLSFSFSWRRAQLVNAVAKRSSAVTFTRPPGLPYLRSRPWPSSPSTVTPRRRRGDDFARPTRCSHAEEPRLLTEACSFLDGRALHSMPCGQAAIATRGHAASHAVAA